MTATQALSDAIDRHLRWRVLEAQAFYEVGEDCRVREGGISDGITEIREDFEYHCNAMYCIPEQLGGGPINQQDKDFLNGLLNESRAGEWTLQRVNCLISRINDYILR